MHGQESIMTRSKSNVRKVDILLLGESYFLFCSITECNYSDNKHKFSRYVDNKIICIIESVDSISRDGPDVTYM